MKLIARVAQSFFAIAMIAFGIQHLVYGDFVTRVVPKLGAYSSSWAYLAGIILVTCGLAILFRKSVRLAALLLGSLILLSFFVFYVPLLLKSQLLNGTWTNAGKALALSGGAFLTAEIGRLVPISRLFLSLFMILGGIQHFLFAQFVAGLVPVWIPGHLFWTYF